MLSWSKIDDWEQAGNAIPHCLASSRIINATINSRFEQKIG